MDAGTNSSCCPPRDLVDALSAAERPLVVGHVNPDVDAIGAMLAVARTLPGEAAIALPGGHFSQKVRFMLELGGGVPIADERRVAASDLAAVVDTATVNRVNVAGKWEAIAGKLVVNIDHHITNPDFGQFNWVVASATSTCELIHHVIAAAGWPMDARKASLLYAGIYADTAAFSLPTVTAAAFEVAAALVRAGADIERIGARLSRSQAPHEFDLLRRVYHNTRLAGDGHIAYSTLTHEEIAAAGCTAEDIDDQVSIPRSLSGIRVAMLFSEAEPGVIRINLRGENGTPVLPLAQKLGGGGHSYSAGVRVRGPIAVVVERVLAEAQQFLAAAAG